MSDDLPYYVWEWRNRRWNRRCIFCRWCEHRVGLDHAHYVCEAKLKVMDEEQAVSRIRPLCPLYSARG